MVDGSLKPAERGQENKRSQMSTKKRQSSALPEPSLLEQENLSQVADDPMDKPFSEEVWHCIRNGIFQF
jgi:hypothetical protein